jgi:hypothetical protein
MAAAGWYADPAGVPGRYRYWDGSRWSSFTTDDPRRPAPGQSPAGGSTPTEPAQGGPPSGPSRKRRLGLIIGVLAVAVTLVVGVAIFTSNFRSLVGNPQPTSTASGSGESSADATTTSTPGPSATPRQLARCPKGDPNLHASHPTDGRVHGGNLSFEEQPTFDPAAVEPRFTFAYDVLQQTLPVSQNPPWIAQLAVGQLRGKDGFVNHPRNTVESLVRCVMTGIMYSPYLPRRTDIRSEGLSIDGHSGWLIDAEITVDRPDLAVAGDHTIFIVVRDGEDWGFFFGAVPLGNTQLDVVLARAVRGLRAS